MPWLDPYRSRPGRIYLRDGVLPPRAARAFAGLGDGSVEVRTPGAPSEMVAAPMRPRTIAPPVSSAGAGGFAAQLQALDASGAYAIVTPLVCNRRWATVSFSCHQVPAALQTSVVVYEQARAVIAGLAALPVPTANDPSGRRAYYSAIVNYAWVMTWASNLLGYDLVQNPMDDGWTFNTNPPNVRQTRPGSPLGMLFSSGTPSTSLPVYTAGVGGQWGPELRATPSADAPPSGTVGVYETFWGSDRDEVRADTGARGEVHHVVYISSGKVFCERARQLASKLATLDFITLHATALSKYHTYLQTMPAHGLPLDVNAMQDVMDAAVLLANTKARGSFVDAATGLTTAATVAATLPVIGTVAGLVLSGVTALISFMGQAAAVGGAFCPLGFHYRVPTPACLAAGGPPLDTPPLSNVTTKTSPVVTAVAVAGGLGLGYMILKHFLLRKG